MEIRKPQFISDEVCIDLRTGFIDVNVLFLLGVSELNPLSFRYLDSVFKKE